VSGKSHKDKAPRTELSRFGVPSATGSVRHTRAAARASGSRLPLATNSCLGTSEKQGSSCDPKKPACAAGVAGSRSPVVPARRRVGASWAAANFSCRPDG